MHTVKRFDNVGEFVAATPTIYPFYDKLNRIEVVTLSESGTPALLAKAESLMDSLMDISLESHAFVHSPDVWGQRLAMGEWLAGSPTCFRRKKRVATDVAPMNVYVSQSASAGISDEALIIRGIAILALVGKLSMIRPVDLWLVNGDPNFSVIIRVENRPLNLSQASFCIGHPQFFRTLAFGHLVYTMGASASLPMPYDPEKPTQVARYKDQIGVTDSDLFIPGTMYGTSPIISNSVEWINSQLAKYANVGEE